MVQEKIITILKSNDDYCSGEEISRKLHISRAGIWKNIEELRKKGYMIEAVPHKGYILKSSPDKLLPQEVLAGLNTKFIGQHIEHHDVIDSTMDEAFRLAMNDCPNGAVVCAEQQTKGRGRMGRHWSSPSEKGVYMSIVLRPNLVATDVAKLTLLSGVAVYEAIKNLYNVDLSIKWPNDILADGKKLCGILTEMNAQMEQVKFIVIGIGLNVNQTESELLPEATSLKVLLNEDASRVALMQNILMQLERWYEKMLDQGFAPIIDQWKKYTSTLNRRIRISDIEGYAQDLDEFGGLVIRTDEGLIVKRMSGDVLEISK